MEMEGNSPSEHTPSREEMIAAIKQKMSAPAPQPDAGPTPTRAEMIQQIQAHLSGQAQAPAAPQEPSILDKQVPLIGGTIRGYAQGAMKALPAAGAVAGAAIGTALGPLGTVGGAGLGAAAGKALENVGEQATGAPAQSLGDQAKGIAEQGVMGAAGEAAAQALPAVAQAAANTPAGKVIVDSLKSAAEAVGNTVAKAGEAIFRVPADVIKAYATNADKISKMAGEAGGDVGTAADSIKQTYQAAIDGTRAQMNQKISSALAGNTETVSGSKIIDALKSAAQEEIDTDLPEGAAQMDQVKQMIDTVRKKFTDLSATNESGKLYAQEANDLKRWLQNQATKAYREGGSGQVGLEAANVAKKAAAVTRSLLNDAVPDVAIANNQLAHLHEIEDRMSSALIKEGKTPGLIAAGTGMGVDNANTLRQMGDATRTNMLGDAQNLAAMQTFSNPSFKGNPLAAAAGGAVGAYATHSGTGVAIGSAIGNTVTSPAALKQAINLGRGVAAPVVNTVGSSLGRSALSQSVIRGNSGMRQLKTAGGGAP